MRTDCTIDSEPIPCKNASTVGSGLHTALPGNLITYTEHYQGGATGTRTGRLLGRVSSKDGKVKSFALVMALSDDCSYVYERWIDPTDITMVREVPMAMLQFFSMQELPPVQELRKAMDRDELTDRFVDASSIMTPIKALYGLMEHIAIQKEVTSATRGIVDSYYDNRNQYD